MSWLLPPEGSIDSSGHFTLIGYGSLTSLKSARETMPSLKKFRRGILKNYCRIFNLVSIVNIRRSTAFGSYLATCTAKRKMGTNLLVVAFDVPATEYAAFAKREARLKHEVIEFEDAAEGGKQRKGLVCTTYSDEDYFKERCDGNLDVFNSEVGQYYSGKLYRSDILPVPKYLDLVLAGHEALGDDYRDNFLDCSFLGDEQTRWCHMIRKAESAMPPRTPPTI